MKLLTQLLTLCLFISCSAQDKAKNNTNTPTSNKATKNINVSLDATSLKAEIDKMEAFFKSNADKPLNKSKAANFVAKSKQFVAAFPDHEVSPAFLFRAAEVSRALSKFDEGIQLLDQVYTQYPDHEKAPVSLFLKAFTYEENKHNSEKAKQYYNEFLQKFPKHDLNGQVQQLLSVIDQSPEDLIKSFQEKNK